MSEFRSLFSVLLKTLLVIQAFLLFACSQKAPPSQKERLEDLKVTEIMYHPSGPDSAEYLEIYNDGERSVSLREIQISGAIEYVFPENAPDLPPGEFIILAESISRFNARYPDVRVYDEYTGSLSNSAGNVLMVDPEGNVFWEGEYSDEHPWPVLADGLGYSLNLEPDESPRLTRNWYTGGFGGTPGRLQSPAVQTAEAQVFISELMPMPQTEPPWLELCNSGNQNVSLDAWNLVHKTTDALDTTITLDGNVSAGKCLVLDLSHTDMYHNRFQLIARDESGRAIYGNTFETGAAIPGVSYGVMPDDPEGMVILPLMTATPGDMNTSESWFQNQPLWTIREVYFNPGSEIRFEFVELVRGDYSDTNQITCNNDLDSSAIQSAIISDYCANRLAELEGFGLDSIPVNIDAGQVVLIVSTEFAEEARSIISEQQSDAVLLTTDGGLSNRGEVLQLLYPWAKGASGWEQPSAVWYSVPVDFVRYEDRSPWPREADGEGKSLNRLFDEGKPLAGYLPESWVAKSPTPGY